MQETNIEQLKKEILELKEKQDAVILAHYYVDGEVQAIADYVGDSYFLSKLAIVLRIWNNIRNDYYRRPA